MPLIARGHWHWPVHACTMNVPCFTKTRRKIWYRVSVWLLFCTEQDHQHPCFAYVWPRSKFMTYNHVTSSPRISHFSRATLKSWVEPGDEAMLQIHQGRLCRKMCMRERWVLPSPKGKYWKKKCARCKDDCSKSKGIRQIKGVYKRESKNGYCTSFKQDGQLMWAPAVGDVGDASLL